MDTPDSSSDSTTSDSDSLYDNNHSWERNREGNKCLFCVEIMDNVVDALNHCRTDHKFDVFEMVEKFSMNRTDYTRFINFIRSKKPEPSAINQCNRPVWKNTNCTRVYVKNDLWLINDIVGLKSKCEDPMPKYVNSESGKVVMFVHHFLELQKRLQELSDKVKEMGQPVNDTQQPYLESQPPSESSSLHRHISCGWHSEYLCAQDPVRSSAYSTALASCSADKTVLVAGWGSITLALLALDGGARSATVLARDKVEEQLVRQVATENDLSDHLGVLQDDQSSSLEFDVIVSEWMGHFLFLDHTLDSVLYARDNLLAPDGIIVPSKFSISMCGVSNVNHPQNLNIAHYNINSLTKLELIKPARESINVSNIITDTALIHSMDLNTFLKSDLYFEADFILRCNQKAVLTALSGYFDVFLSKEETNPLVTTSPYSDPSHWKQTVFYLSTPESCDVGTILNCSVRCSQNQRFSNGVCIELSINGNNHSYEFPIA